MECDISSQKIKNLLVLDMISNLFPSQDASQQASIIGDLCQLVCLPDNQRLLSQRHTFIKFILETYQ